MHAEKRSENTTSLLYITLAALGIRFLLPFTVLLTGGYYKLFYAPDTYSYLAPAKELLLSGRFYSNGIPELSRTPGYPLFLIPGIYLGHVEIVTIVMQVILACLTAYLVFRISMLLFKNTKAAALSAFMFAIDPVSVLYASKLL
jgi:4-amino-4-deoxy-L-arabinose transferase-like glycosyltransferase